MKRHHFIIILLIIVIVSFIFITSLFFIKQKNVTSPITSTSITSSSENLLTSYDTNNAVSVLYTNEDADIDNTILIAPGTIVMWYTSPQAPSGWALCDGTQGTPNLTGHFIKGGNLSNSSISPKTGEKGGKDKIYLNINNIPDHLHSATVISSYNGEHDHYGQTDPYNHTHTYKVADQTNYMDSSVNDYTEVWNKVYDSDGNADTSTVDGHQHNFERTSKNGEHIHQINVKVDSFGYDNPIPIEINPPHFKLNFIMKLEGKPDDNIRVGEKNVLHADQEGNIMSTVLVPRGIIVMWNGYNIPYGWALCNGENDTPNLENMFVKSTKNDDYNKVGLSTINIYESNLPKHTHDAVCYLEKNGEHDHSVTDDESGGHSHRYSYKYKSDKPGDSPDILAGKTDILKSVKSEETSEDSHTHNFTTSSTGKHFHTITSYNVSEVGEGQPVNINPPYYVLCYIMKI